MAQAEAKGGADRRPLSPHLTIYRPMLTMVMSIAHRISGGALYLCAALLGLYLVGLAFGSWMFSLVSWIANGFTGHVILVGFTWALFHHLLGGARHALWDRGLYMDPQGRELLAQATLYGAVALTAAIWVCATLSG